MNTGCGHSRTYRQYHQVWRKKTCRAKVSSSMGELWELGHQVTSLSLFLLVFCCYSVTKSCSTLWSRELQHTRLPCLSLAPEVCSNSCSSNQWCHPTISSSVIPFSSSPPSFPASGSFPMSQFFTSGGQSIGALASASVLPMNIQDWSPLGLYNGSDK